MRHGIAKSNVTLVSIICQWRSAISAKSSWRSGGMDARSRESRGAVPRDADVIGGCHRRLVAVRQPWLVDRQRAVDGGGRRCPSGVVAEAQRSGGVAEVERRRPASAVAGGSPASGGCASVSRGWWIASELWIIGGVGDARCQKLGRASSPRDRRSG